MGSFLDDALLVEARPGGSQGGGVGYSDFDGQAPTQPESQLGETAVPYFL